MKSQIYLDVGMVGDIWDFVSKQITTVNPLVPQITALNKLGACSTTVFVPVYKHRINLFGCPLWFRHAVFFILFCSHLLLCIYELYVKATSGFDTDKGHIGPD